MTPRVSSLGGSFVAYALPDCVDAEPTGTSGGAVPPIDLTTPQALPLNECVKSARQFPSFRARKNDPDCPKNGKAHIIAYYTVDCTGQGVDAGTLEDPVSNPCIAMPLLGVQKLQGQSARFTCQTA